MLTQPPELEDCWGTEEKQRTLLERIIGFTFPLHSPSSFAENVAGNDSEILLYI